MAFRLIDLSQEIFTGAPVWPGHAQTVVEVVDTHESTRASGRFTEDYGYASETICMSTHGTTHVDAVSHVDPSPGALSIEKIPLDWFHTGGICIDLSHIPPLALYTVNDIKQALAKHRLEIRKGDTVLVYSGHYTRTYGSPAYLTDYPGFGREAAEWVYDQGAVNIGVDAPSHDAAGSLNYPAHQVCREKQKLNTENLGDLKPVVGKRFQYIGFPLKIRRGTGSPIRAVAIVEE